MSIYLRNFVFSALALLIAVGFSSGVFAQGKGHGGGGGNGKGHGNGGGGGQPQINRGGGNGGNRGGGGWQQPNRGGGGQPQINRGGGNGNGWGRMKHDNRGGGVVYTQPQPQYRQPQVQRQRQVWHPSQIASPISQPNWKAERRIQKWNDHADDHRGRGFFNKRPLENFYRQQQRQQSNDRRMQSWQPSNVPSLSYDRNWRRWDDNDQGVRWSGRYSYQPSYQPYYQPYIYQQYRSYAPYVPHVTQYDYYQPTLAYGSSNYYPSYYSGGSRTEMIVRSVISSIFGGGTPFGGVYVNDPYYYDPYYANGGYYNYNGYYYNQPVYNFYDQVVCNPATYYSNYYPTYSDYALSYYTPAYYAPGYTTTTYYTPAYYDSYSYSALPYGYSNYGYGNSLLSMIPGVGKLDRQTGGTISRVLIAALGGAYSRGYDDGLLLDQYGYSAPAPFLGTTYVSTTYLPASLRTDQARQIFNEGYELGYRDAVAQRDPYGRLDVVSCFLGQSIGV